ncbi:hypothetical protein BTO05_11565 [Winogradskyella sp. PC-19]|uniref:DUF6090 family protein n=1 Tax=unclassified Winogradskyella TaxID=2615021 RepID=UPI000B3D0CE5|nr:MULTISPECIES: DUF6090 family protein [unclassified Winogradskyella]ARV10242.1 hypothetical protein BTO05_11565 [Winogradskyella sp. PC-19]RZN82370.1 MAG: hypothetical protein EVB12_02990 [Winogradskyella sp.]
MIKFFRRVRQRLLTENKFSKYLIYAIGEIVLVVIGILIALQINNWNEQSKSKKSADVQLNLLYQNISDDLIQLNTLSTKVKNNLTSCKKLSEQFQQITPFDSLTTSYIIDNIFEYNFYGNTSAYDKLNQNGEFSLLPITLQSDITYFYNLLYRVTEREEIANTFIKKDFEPYYFDNYSKYHRKGSNKNPITSEYYKNDRRKPIALDVETIKNDHKMATLIFARYYQLKQQQDLYAEAIEKAQNIQKLIEKNPSFNND